MAQPASAYSEHTAFVPHPLEFERNTFCSGTRTAMQCAEFNTIFILNSLEQATKSVSGLGTLCKLARNNLELMNMPNESPALAPRTMESLFELAEVSSSLFITELETLADQLEQWATDERGEGE